MALGLIVVCEGSASLDGRKGAPGELPRATLREMTSFRARSGDGRDFYALRWKRRRDVVVLLFRTRRIQGETLNRIAAFVEKKGVRGKVLTDARLRAYIRRTNTTVETFYLAHDYRVGDLARFFNRAHRQERLTRRAVLNAREGRLLKFLIREKMLRAGRVGLSGSAQVVLSFPLDISMKRRRDVLLHEVRHALYFVDAHYQQVCDEFWRSLPAQDRQLFRAVIKRMAYDVKDGYLLRNEFQAYLLQKVVPFENYLPRYVGGPNAAVIRAYMAGGPRAGRLAALRKQLRARLAAKLGSDLP